jgi:cysteine desulfurase/selenocysteine lyase
MNLKQHDIKYKSILMPAQAHEIIFTSGTTHSINLVAHGFASFLEKGDELIVSELEHHANIVPWQMLCERTGAALKVIPITANGTLDMGVYADLLNERTKVVFVNHVSNALGIINPIEEIIEKAHACWCSRAYRWCASHSTYGPRCTSIRRRILYHIGT